MFALLASVSLAATPTADFYVPPRLRGAPAGAQPPPLADGADLLDVYAAGDLCVMHDADGEWMSELLSTGLDINWVLESIHDAFFTQYQDEYGYFTIHLVRDPQIFVAFYSPMSNDVRGIGYEHSVGQQLFDISDTLVEGMIFMNYVGLWIDNPEQGRYVFDQEFGHRWGSFVQVEKDGVDPEELLGRDTAHWSFYLDTPNSPMEGNAWVDDGDGSWSTDKASGSTYSDLDLYLMGLLAKEDVADMTLLQESGASPYEAATAPIFMQNTESITRDATLDAAAVTLSVDDVITAEGNRMPSVENSPKSFRMAHIILVLDGDELDADLLAQIDGLRTTWETDWEEDVRGLADLDTTLGETTAPCWPETPDACIEEEVDSGDTDDSGDSGDSDAIDCCKEEAPGGCGCDAGGGMGLAGALLAFGALARRGRGE